MSIIGRERLLWCALVVHAAAGWAGSAQAQPMYTHSIPLKMPKGVQGVQPDLAIAYNSNSGNGPLGMGWEVTGLSSISRVNYGTGIHFSRGVIGFYFPDTYAHSQLGVLVPQPDGSYRTKVESFAKFVPSVDTCGTGPCSWTMTDRQGIVHRYGVQPDSRVTACVDANDCGYVQTWGLSQVQDLFGNSYSVSYDSTYFTGLLAVSRVTYSQAANISVTRAVQFNYLGNRSASDQGMLYPSGGTYWMRGTLDNIAISSGSTTLRVYKLGYEQGSVTGRTHLTSFSEYAGDSSSLLVAQAFGWQQGSESISAGPDLLNLIKNGIGGEVAIFYAPAPKVSAALMPDSGGPGIANASPRQLVTQVVARAGNGDSVSTSYRYYDGRILPGTIPNQRDLGFAAIDTIDDQTGLWSRTIFRQDPPFEGHVATVSDYDRTNDHPQLLRQTERSYDCVVPATGAACVVPASGTTELVRETSTVSRTYELGVQVSSQTTTRIFDPYGNVRVLSQAADFLPEVSITTTYVNDETNWVLGRVTNILTMSGTTRLGEVHNTWTGNTITTKSEWLDTKNSWVDTVMTYDANGNLESVKAPPTGDGNTRLTTTTYDSTFHAYPVQVKNAMGQITYRTHNADGLIESETDANGQVTSIRYDIWGRRSSEVRPDGGSTMYAYANYGNPTAQYDEVATYVGLDPNRVLFRREYFDGTGFKYRVVSNGDCGSDTIMWGGLAYQYVSVVTLKDSAGRPSMVSHPYCGGDEPLLWTTTYYDNVTGRPTYVQTADGMVQSYTYGYGYINGNAYVSQYAGVIDPTGLETRKYLDARGDVTTLQHLKGTVLDATTYTYDPLRRLLSATPPDNSKVSYTYDSLNRRTSVTGATTWGGTSVTYAYDALSRVRLKQAAGEPDVNYTYDETAMQNGIGRLTTVSDTSGVTQFSYTALGQPKGQTKTVDGHSFSQTLTYDIGGRLTRVVYPSGDCADYGYTNGGNLKTLTLNDAPPPAVATWSLFDASGRPGRVDLGNGVGTTYTYDAVGHLTGLSTGKGASVLQDLTHDWYSNNAAGLTVGSIADHRTNKVLPCAVQVNCNTDESQSFIYDDLQRLHQATSPAWGTKTYLYDASGNPTNFGGVVNRVLPSYSGHQVLGGTGLSNVNYDNAGHMVTKTLDGVSSNYWWTAEGRLASVERNGVQAAQMTYDANGARVKKVYTPVSGPAVTTTYFSNLYEKRTFSDGSPEVHTLHLFAHGQIVASVTRTGSILTASNDANGWREQVALGSLYNPASLSGFAGMAMSYGKALTTHPLVRKWCGFAIFAAFFALMAWLVARSMVVHAYGRSLTGRVRLSTLGVLLVFASSACGVASVGGDGPGGHRGPQFDITGNTLNGPSAGPIYYHRNQISSSTVITDGGGNEVTRAVYLPFGEISQPNSVGSEVASSKFTGKELDEETGLYYYGARYYDPAIGRFISADSVIPSLADPEAFNRYSYVRNNPVVYVDPTGHSFHFAGDFFPIAALATGQGWAIAFDRKAVSSIYDAAKAHAKSLFDVNAWNFKNDSLGVWADRVGFLAAVVAGAAGHPNVVYAYLAATAASTGATSIATRAGVTDQTTLTVIGAVAGALAGQVAARAVDYVQLAIAGGIALLVGLSGLKDMGAALGFGMSVYSIVNALVPRRVYAVAGGTVIDIGWQNPENHNKGWGFRVIIRLGPDTIDVYAHLTPGGQAVHVGQLVKAGDLLSSYADPKNGESNGPHVHFERRVNGIPGPVTFGIYRPVGPKGVQTGKYGDVYQTANGPIIHRGYDFAYPHTN